MIPDQFAVIRPESERKADRFDQAVEVLRSGVANGVVRNKDLQDAKSTLGAAIYDAWQKTVSSPFFWAGKYEEQSEEINLVNMAVSVSTLHDCLSAVKKVNAFGLSGPVIDAMRAVLDEASPLAEAAKSLKTNVVKGRAPNPNPKPVNPDKKIGTCSCCFRGIAVAGNAGMAHHGYERPGTGSQTSSCSGIRFPSLEISLEGLEWGIGVTEKRLASLRENLVNAPDLTEVPWIAYEVRHGQRVPVARVCQAGDPDFAKHHRNYVRRLDAEVYQTGSNLTFLNEKLDEWRAWHGLEGTPAVEEDETPSP